MMPNDIPVTREMVYDWLVEYTADEPDQTLREFLEDKLEELHLKDATVSTVQHEDRPDETPLVDMILDDIPSYEPKPPTGN